VATYRARSGPREHGRKVGLNRAFFAIGTGGYRGHERATGLAYGANAMGSAGASALRTSKSQRDSDLAV
jgi:hypothetical protein